MCKVNAIGVVRVYFVVNFDEHISHVILVFLLLIFFSYLGFL